MLQKRIRRAAVVGALIATLALAAPAQASNWRGSWAPGTNLWKTAWAWLTDLLPGAMVPATPADRGSRGLTKGSSSTVPEGTTSNSTSSTCETNCERSSSIDPNG